MSTTELDAILRQFNCYRSTLPRVRGDVIDVIRRVGTLTPKSGSLVLNTGRECRLLMLEGTVAIQYRGGNYNIPIEIFITEQYPAVPPMVYVRPTRDMDIKKGHRHVDSAGLVYLPYLHEWAERASTLVQLCVELSKVFSQDPPVYARQSTVPQPAHAATHTQPSGYGSMGAQQPSYNSGSSSTGHRAEPQRDSTADTRDALTAKLQGILQSILTDLRDSIDAEFDEQSALRDSEKAVDTSMSAAEQLKEELSGAIQRASQQRDALIAHIVEHNAAASQKTEDPEELVEPADTMSRQLVALVAENAAIDDALYYLDMGLVEKQLSTDDFLKEVRKLARKQFTARALAEKVRTAQEASAKSRSTRQQNGTNGYSNNQAPPPYQPPQQQQQQQQQHHHQWAHNIMR